jgi:hypothetical protein
MKSKSLSNLAMKNRRQLCELIEAAVATMKNRG